MTTMTRQALHPALTGHSFFRFSVEDYHRMIDNGTVAEGERVELLDGYLVEKMVQKSPHASTVSRLAKRLMLLLPEGWTDRSQLPMTLSESEPEPDAAIVRGDDRTYSRSHPGAADAAIVMEVADSTLRVDRELMSEIYARDGIPAYWIINLVDNQIEVRTDPDTDARLYRMETVYKPGDSVPIVLDGQSVATIAVSDLLP